MLNYHVGTQNIPTEVRKEWSDKFNNMSDQELSVLSCQKRNGIATYKALLAQEILWVRNGAPDTEWKEELAFENQRMFEQEY